MNLDWWKIFYEVALAQNISKASDKLHISQPAITKQIKNLEDYLNCKLFIRSQKGVILTPSGKAIFEDIKASLNLIKKAEQKIKDSNELLTGQIRIGISTTLAKTYLMPYIRKFNQKYPQVTFEISTDPTSYLKNSMRKGQIDFIIAKFPFKIIDDFKYIKLGQMEDIFITNKDYPDLINKKISLNDIAKYPILLQKQPSSSRDYIEKYYEANNIPLHTVMEIASSNLLIEFVKIGYGIGVVTKEYVKKELQNKELFEIQVTPKIIPRDFGIITLKNNYLSKACELFLESLYN